MFTHCSKLTSSIKSKCRTILNSSQHINQPSVKLFIPCTNSLAVSKKHETTHRFYCTTSQSVQEAFKAELKELAPIFPELINHIVDNHVTPNCSVDSAVARMKEALEYNLPKGKRLRAILVKRSFQQFSGKNNEEDLHLAKVLGGCVEMLQAVLTILDDVMDQAETRRNEICWYKKQGIGMTASTDAFLLEQSLYLLLKNYFRDKPYYGKIVELFNETSYQTAMGQCLDMITQTGGINLKRFTKETHAALAKFKTTYYTFYLPVVLGMHMAGITDERLNSKAKAILIDLGHLYQVQDDYIDCYGDEVLSGKISTDIEVGKCNWLITKALEMANSEQIAVLVENYGKKDPACVAKIKGVYEELNMKTVCEKYEDQRYKEILESIEELPPELSPNIFKDLNTLLYKRTR